MRKFHICVIISCAVARAVLQTQLIITHSLIPQESLKYFTAMNQVPEHPAPPNFTQSPPMTVR